jgi:hypothetical protein
VGIAEATKDTHGSIGRGLMKEVLKGRDVLQNWSGKSVDKEDSRGEGKRPVLHRERGVSQKSEAKLDYVAMLPLNNSILLGGVGACVTMADALR